MTHPAGEAAASRRGCRASRSPPTPCALLHALAYNLANFPRTLALPDEIKKWSLRTLREKFVKIGANLAAH